MPRSDVVIAGVSWSHMPVSQTSATSAFSSSLLASTNSGRNFEPSSSAPSTRNVMSIGSEPVTAFQARQASTKVITWPLSSAGAARADHLAAVGQGRRSAARRAASPTGRADRPAARRNGRRTARAAVGLALARGRPPPDGRRVSRKAASKPSPRARPPAIAAALRQSSL